MESVRSSSAARPSIWSTPGRNHSDSSIVMLLPKEKILFAVDFNSLGAVPSRLVVNDTYPIEWETSLKKTLELRWERTIPGHPGPNVRLGTRKDMEADCLHGQSRRRG